MKAKRRLRIRSFKKGRPSDMVKDRKVEDSYEDGDSPYDINQELTRRRAKELYILYGWDKKQLLGLGIPESTLDVWLYQPTQGRLSWKAEKEVFEATVFDKMKENKAEELKDVQGHLLKMIKRGLLDNEDTVLTVSQVEKLTNTLSKLNMIIQLAENKPTSINADIALTQKDINDIVMELDKLDPLMDYGKKIIN